MAREVFDPNATDGDGDGVVQDGTKFERPADTLPEGFDPNATDGDGDGLVQDGTEFERPIEKQEPVDVPKPAAPKPQAKKEEPKPEPVKKNSAPKISSEKVAVFSEKNAYWEGLGRLSRGHNIVSREDSEKWLTLGYVREATPDEIKAL